MPQYENPANGYREAVGASTIVWTVLFGWVYMTLRGLYALVLGELVLVLLAALTAGGAGGFLAGVIFWVLNAMIVPGALEKKYLRAGWRRVPRGG